jgi:hypothetical protein
MINKSHNDRIDSFEKIKELILNDSYVFDDYFDYSEKKCFQSFMDELVSVYSKVSAGANIINSIDHLIIELEDALKNNLLEEEIQNTVDLLRAFTKGHFTYFKSKNIYVSSLKLFIHLLKTSNTEKKNIIKLGVTNRLRKIEKITEQDNPFSDDIPF